MLGQLLTRIKVLAKRSLATVGVREEVGLIPVAVAVGAITALLAVAFHELIEFLKHTLWERRGGDWLYGPGLWALVAIPAAGGLVVGLVSRYLIRSQGSHGVVDVIESVLRTRGFVRPITAVEKIFTSAITIGSGGSCGAEGPIVQIGAAVSSFVGSVLNVSRQRMPLLVGCGTAAGISSIFHSPIGGVLFTLEVILRDFSVRTFVPVVVASVVATVVTEGAFKHIDPDAYRAIFAAPMNALGPQFSVNWSQATQFAILGLMCGFVGVCQTKMMLIGDRAFTPLKRLGPFRPAIGGAALGILGVLYVLLFGWLIDSAKPVPFAQYPMPAFFGDGYGVVRSMLEGTFAPDATSNVVIALLLALIVLKLLGTTLTLTSGGSGGIIAPALVLGATTGLLLGKTLTILGFESAQPTALAVVGMGAVLAAIVHAPLASILIVFELTQTPGVIVPAMLATVTAHGIARLVFADSVYTITLRQRGLSPEAAADMPALRKFAIDHLPLEPIVPLKENDPVQRALDLAAETDRSNFIVTDAAGKYRGLITAQQLSAVLMQEAAIPLLTVSEVMRTDIKPLRHTENLASLFDAFIVHDIDALPVGLEYDPNKTIGIVTRDALLKHYRRHWKES